MPNSLEAEQSVVGSMIMDKDAIVTAMEMLLKEDFYHQQYGIIFDAMVELYSEGQPVDLVTLQNKLKEKDVPKEVSSLEFVGELVRAVPTSANVKYYCNIVKENAMKRKLIRVTEDIENECYAGKESLESVLDKTEHDVFALLSSRTGGEYVPIRQVVMNALEKIEKASQQSGTVTGIPTGFIDLDYRTAGLQPSDLVLVAARPSMGKTAFVLNIAQYVAFHENLCTAIFSLEMSKEQLVNRLFSLDHTNIRKRLPILPSGYCFIRYADHIAKFTLCVPLVDPRLPYHLSGFLFVHSDYPLSFLISANHFPTLKRMLVFDFAKNLASLMHSAYFEARQNAIHYDENVPFKVLTLPL